MSADAWFAPGGRLQTAAGNVLREGAGLKLMGGLLTSNPCVTHVLLRSHQDGQGPLTGAGTALGFGLR